MFCNNCGRQVMENTQFCQYCGSKTEMGPQRQDVEPLRTDTTIMNGIKSFSAFEIIIAAGLGVIALMWCIKGLFGLFLAKNILAFVGIPSMIIGMILYCIPGIAVTALSITGVLLMLRKNYVISIGVLIFGIALLVKIGGWIFVNFTGIGTTIAYAIVAPYSSIAGWTLFLAAIVSILLYSKASHNLHR